MEGIEDLEGSNQSDVLYGNEGDNQLLGHKGADAYFGLGGNDSILANSGSADRVINCGPGFDQATIDLAAGGRSDADRMRAGPRRGGRRIQRTAAAERTAAGAALPPPTPPKPDRTPPQTKLSGHPAKLLKVRAGGRKPVAFRFAQRARSALPVQARPQALRRLPLAAQVPRRRRPPRLPPFAIDAAGNRDRTPPSSSSGSSP